MFQLKYDNVFLDLVPNQDCEIERNSPLFLIDNFFVEVSTPISLAYSDTNAKALGYYFFEPTVRTKKKIPIQVYDRGTYKCNATLVIESAGMNYRNKGASTAGGYIMLGISDFLQLIQKQKLTDLKLGGDRNFNFTTWDAFDASAGFFQHFHDTWDGMHDYVFAPCRNETWTGSSDDPFSTGYMNTLDVTTTPLALKANQPVVPFVFVKFILECIFQESGWSVDFSGLNDTEWEKLILWGVKPLYTTQQTYNFNADANKLEVVDTPLGQLKIHLADFMPPDYTCAQFITALCFRYGWVPIISTTTRTARFVAVKEMKTKAAKDWTDYAASVSASQISVDKKIFAFKNDFEGSDNFPSAPDFSSLFIAGAVNAFQDLPDPSSGSYDNAVIYVYKDNQYYEVALNEDSTARIWQVFTDNIYDEDPPAGVDATQTFETKCTTLPVYKTLFRTDTGVNYYIYLPVCDQSRNEKFGIKTLLYHGMVKEVKEDGTDGTLEYPFASSTSTRHDSGTDLLWSNVYRHKDTNGNDDGLIQYWWQNWLDIVSNVEDAFKKRYYLPLHELLKFQWDDIILDRNIPYLVKQMIEPLPYKGYVECTMQRIALVKPAADETESPDVVYLKLTYENYVNDQHFEYFGNGGRTDWDNATTANIIVRAYSDAAGTIPLDLTGFNFQTATTKQIDYTNGSHNTYTELKSWIMNGNTINVNYQPFNIVEGDMTIHYVGYSGAFDGHRTISQVLVVDSRYTIIP